MIDPHILLTLDEACDKAFAYHRAGQLDAAEQIYRAILQAAPKHPAANHFLGLLSVQLQQPQVGLPHLLAALEAKPEIADYWLAYLDALLLLERTDEARQVLALGQQHGLAGKAVEDIAARLVVRPTYEAENTLVVLFNQGRHSEGVALARVMTEQFPQHGFGWKVLGALLRSQGCSADALEPLQKSAQLEPQDAQAQSNLGLVLGDLNRLPEAEASHRRALAINPCFADAHNNLGSTLKLQGRLAEAEASFQTALTLNPDYADAHNNLGVTLYEQNRFSEAETAYRAALAIQANYAEAYNNLGNTLSKQHRLAEAETNLRRALHYRPHFADAHYNLASALRALGRQDEAIDCFRQALSFKPDFAEAHLNLGVTLNELGRLSEAENSYRAALAAHTEYPEAYNNLGNTLREQGRLPEAEASYRHALTLKPAYPEAHSNLLFNQCCAASRTPFDCCAEARQYGLMLGNLTGAPYSAWACPAQPTRLRVGLISGDLRNHPVGYFLESLVSHIDPARIELIAYPTNSHYDDLSARLAPFFAAWKPLADYGDAEAARLIHADGVHILIDAAGHTAGNRLPVFAWKPAPIQVSWLGYFATTGVAEIDYLLGDSFVVPEQENEHFTEKIWRLPESYLCFTAPDIPLKVAVLPALLSGCITFGSFNNLSKMNQAVIALWARVLHAVPKSRLFLKTRQLNDLALCASTYQHFATFGISADRLILEGSSPRAELLAAYHRVDIALDPFPYPGGTTSVEALWMGVPLLTRRGDRFLSHMGESIVHNAGLSDWIAADDDDYVAKAVDYSANLEQLAVIRANLRAQLLASPLFNAPRFARNFEAALWGMWQQRSAQ